MFHRKSTNINFLFCYSLDILNQKTPNALKSKAMWALHYGHKWKSCHPTSNIRAHQNASVLKITHKITFRLSALEVSKTGTKEIAERSKCVPGKHRTEVQSPIPHALLALERWMHHGDMVAHAYNASAGQADIGGSL